MNPPNPFQATRKTSLLYTLSSLCISFHKETLVERRVASVTSQ